MLGFYPLEFFSQLIILSHLTEIFETRVATLIQFQPIRHGDGKRRLSLLGGEGRTCLRLVLLMVQFGVNCREVSLGKRSRGKLIENQ
jgi:hypothetical protein